MLVELRDLPTPLFRIGRGPDPLVLPPFEFVGEGRYDDPRNDPKYRVLYCGARVACFHETLSQFAQDITGVVPAEVPSDWLGKRKIATFSINDPSCNYRWLDIGNSQTIAHLRAVFGARAAAVGIQNFDLSMITYHALPLTKDIGLWVFQQGFSGIAYPSRHGADLRCFAIFDSALSSIVCHRIDPIMKSDPDLVHVASLWGLSIR